MPQKRPRIEREKRTIGAMMEIYCHDHHAAGNELCPQCRDLLDYARMRLDACPFQEQKTNCAKCTVHCYKPGMREKIKTVMRHAGPRMIYRHPLMALYHFLDGLRKEPLVGRRKK